MLNEYSFDNIYIRHAIDEKPNDNDFSMHIHELCEIYFYISGGVEYLVEGSVYQLSGPSIMIMRPAEAHRVRIIDDSRYERYAINFPLNFLDEFDPEHRLMRAFLDRPLGINNLLDDSILDMDMVNKLFSQIFNDCKDDYDKRLSINTHLTLLIELIYQAFNKSNKTTKTERKPRSRAEKIIAYTNNNLFKSISVPELAAHFYLSTPQFNRLFRQATGASPWEYITKKRLTAAKEKIHNGSSAYEASESCGFKDYSSFYRAYTKYFKCSPTSDN